MQADCAFLQVLVKEAKALEARGAAEPEAKVRRIILPQARRA